jgi:hypothetical protein
MRARQLATIGALACAACGASTPDTADRETLVGRAVLGPVWPDESGLAYFDAAPGRLDEWTPAGAPLVYRDLASRADTPVAETAYDAALLGDTLLVWSAPIVTIPAGKRAATGVWRPGWSSVARLTERASIASASDAAQERLAILDGVDDATPARVVTVDLAACTPNACAATELATGADPHSIEVSRDGRFVAWTATTGEGPSALRETWLASFDGARRERVATTPLPSPLPYIAQTVHFSPNGELLAATAGDAAHPLRLAVIATKTGQTVAWSALPTGSVCTDVTFGADDALYVIAHASSGARSLWRTGPTSSAHVVDATFFTLDARTPALARWLVVSTASEATLASRGPMDLALLDLATPGAKPIPAATATLRGMLRFRDDGGAVAVLDGAATNQTTGALYGRLASVSLPDGHATDVASYAATPRFAPHAGPLLYFGPPNDSAPPPGGLVAATLHAWEGASTTIDADARGFATSRDGARLYVSTAHAPTIYRRPMP